MPIITILNSVLASSGQIDFKEFPFTAVCINKLAQQKVLFDSPVTELDAGSQMVEVALTDLL